jgi:hypothetical protein
MLMRAELHARSYGLSLTLVRVMLSMVMFMVLVVINAFGHVHLRIQPMINMQSHFDEK